jgi:RecA-family ATPase
VIVQFPETVQSEWRIVAEAALSEVRLRQRIERDTMVEREVERLRVRHEATLMFQQELDAADTPVLEMLTLADYNANPAAAPADLIEGVVKDNGLCIMLGPSGSGKSTVALQMLHSMQSGTHWLGQQTMKISGSVGILSYDMDASMVMDWMSGYPGIDPSKVSVVNAYKRGNPIGVPALRKTIAEAWRRMGVEVVVLDSFSASFFGHDQNDAAATMAHYRDMKLFALTEVGAKALIVITHSTASNPNTARGSSVHHDVADSIVSVSADQSGSRTVRMVKYRAARGQRQMDPVVVTAPDDVTHLVSLDVGAMTLAGLALPAGAVAAAFPDLPDPINTPETSAESDEEDEDL